ncbi:GerAB/ArcD/ProY family transporter [Paenibacillus mendelii]|uniref:Endospore germination permease n=1 Tax=Paenibacillus mendelii TaxID=206163 RepID=A0ABV6J5F9_9BACL|nr:endospore germination permease [Paenibacillus mendelii]MCQ6561748.1 endospore germination permease [Paenibacillus mendelii]
MIEKGKISAFQMGVMMYPTIFATAILSLPSIIAVQAGRDMWLSPIWASTIGFLAVCIAYQLHKLYPKETIVEYSVHLVGRIVGKIMGLMFIFFYMHLNGFIIREYGEFVVGNFFVKTPIIVVIGSMVIVCAFAVRGGVEVLGRCAQIFVPIVIILILLIVFLLSPDLKPIQIYPIMEHGVKPSLMGAVVPSDWFSEFIVISFLLPYLTDREKGMKWGMISVFAVMLTMVLSNMTALFLFGINTVGFRYPVMVAARYISLANFLEHLESIVMAIWIVGAFVKISVFYYVIVLGTAQWLKLTDYRPIVWPVGFLLVLFSVWVAPNVQEMTRVVGTSIPFYLLSMQVAVPTLLLFIAFIQKKFRKKGRAKG